jgi:pimeloyl-ACP methyl ester carboxylesterase
MLLAAAHPTAIAGAVLHDIGPVIEPDGLARIKSYVGKLPLPSSPAEGAQILRRLFQVQFPKLTNDQWHAAAARAWKIDHGALVPTYDSRLAQTFAAADGEQPVPTLWKEFDTLSQVPVLVIRGANSDILSAATVGAMRAHHPGLQSIEVPDQGHVPLLEGAELIQRIKQFVRSGHIPFTLVRTAAEPFCLRRRRHCFFRTNQTKEKPRRCIRRGYQLRP